MIDGINPDNILQGKTDVVIGRPTQYHHNDNGIRVRKSYNRKTVSPQTKVNIYTLLSGEQQTHNFYAEHGMMYAMMIYAELMVKFVMLKKNMLLCTKV